MATDKPGKNRSPLILALAVALGGFAGSMALDVASLSGKFACFAEDCL